MKKKSLLTHLTFVACLFGAATSVYASERINLGRTILLENGNQAAKIPLVVCRKTDAIKLIAKRDLHLNKVIVHFQNGSEKTIHFYRDLKKGKETDWRKFAYKRCVKNIEVFGNSDGSKAGIKVVGRKN